MQHSRCTRHHSQAGRTSGQFDPEANRMTQGVGDRQPLLRVRGGSDPAAPNSGGGL